MTLVDLAESGQLAELQHQLDRGHDINSRASDGRTALHAALAEAQLETAILLLERGADPALVDASGWGCLHWAASSNNRTILELARDASHELIDIVDTKRRTALSWASQTGNTVTVKWLLQNGADPNLVNNNGWAPLHFAAADGHAEVLQVLLKAGAHALLRLPSGHSARDLANYYSKRPEVCLLLEAAEAALE